MQIRELFAADVTRDIPPVVYFHEQSPEMVRAEVSEYIITGGFPEGDPRARRYAASGGAGGGAGGGGIHEQFVHLLRGVTRELSKKGGPELPAAWISGFYGSGKSSFTKLLGLALDGVALPDGTPLEKALLARDDSPLRQELVDAWQELRSKVERPIAVVFDIGGVARDDEHIHCAALRQLQVRLGYCSKSNLVADHELRLEKDGEWDRFLALGRQVLGKDWSVAKEEEQADDHFSHVLHVMNPDRYRDPVSWLDSRAGARTGAGTSVREVVDAIEAMMRLRAPGRRLFLVIDEVSQYVLLALTLQFGAVSAERCWDQLRRVPDFSGIDRSEFDAVVAHMLREDYLFESGGLLSMGEQAERVFGKKNFLELYAVFSSPVLFRVVTPTGREIGSLEQGFVDRLVEQMSSFLLGGRAWAVEHVNHKDRVVVVKDAPRGQKPSWGGFIPQMLGPELCQRIRQIHTETTRYPYVSEQAHAVIDAARGDLGDLLRRPGPAVQLDDRAARWWTFAGGRVNHTLKYGLEILEGWRVVADNFQLRTEGDGVSHDTVRRAIDKLADPAWWRDPATERAILARLPEYRLSKFQRCLPERYGVEVVGAYLLDLGGAGVAARAQVVAQSVGEGGRRR